MNIFRSIDENAGKDNKIANKIQGGGACCTNNIVQKCLLFAVGLFLIFGAAGGKTAQAAVEIVGEPPAGCKLNAIVHNYTIVSRWTDEGKLDQTFYSKMEREYENGYTTEDTALEIETAAQFMTFRKFINEGNSFAGKFVCLTNNIDFGGRGLKITYDDQGNGTQNINLTGDVENCLEYDFLANSDKYFSGTFDGCMYSISNFIYLGNDPSLFSECSNATIKNVIVNSDSAFIDASYMSQKVAGIVSIAYNSTIENCCNAAFIGDNNYASAGICGYAGQNTIIKNCCNLGNIFGAPSAGIAYSYYSDEKSISNCYSIGQVNGFWGDFGPSCFLSENFGGGQNGFPELTNLYYNSTVPGMGSAVSVYDGNAFNAVDDNNFTNVKGLTTEQMQGEAAKTNMVGFADATYNGKPVWLFEEGQYPKLNTAIANRKKRLKSSDFVCTHPKDMFYDGKGKTITIAPKPGITGIGAVTIKYYKVNSDGTLGDASTTLPTDAGRYKVKFDVASGTEYYSAKDLPAMF